MTSILARRRLIITGLAVSFLSLGTATAAIAGPPPPGPPHGPSVSSFDGSYSNTSYNYTNLTDPGSHVSPNQLGPNGSATFTTTISADRNAAQWNDSTAELLIAGFRPAGHGHGRTLYGDGSLIYAQDNSMGAGYCANDQFLDSSGNFIFGNGDACYVHNTPSQTNSNGHYGSTETYSVTIHGDNTFTDTVTIDSGCSNCTSGPYSSGDTATFTGTLSLPPTTQYYPSVYMLPGRVNYTATYTVSGSSFNWAG